MECPNRKAAVAKEFIIEESAWPRIKHLYTKNGFLRPRICRVFLFYFESAFLRLALRYIKNNRLSKLLPHLTSKILERYALCAKQPILTWPAWSSVQHSEYTGPSHTTRHASRPWHCSVLKADDAYHSHVYSTAGTLTLYSLVYFSMVLPSFEVMTSVLK